ncbi:hypothetical protein ASZ78_012596 [Callipepla squamata]|uniref:Alpha-N-acetylneuraminide alpha-2,8-sialyltransferase n=1 Tax=Callipepla squamata TaxID=9009 RepID=A0A226MSK5_CALSU|nr:hypothetical protein ASZ78_012596 [Callipepla squamata]
MAGLAWKWPRTRLPVGASALGVFVLCWLYVFPVYRLPDEKEIVQGVLLQQGKAWRRNHTAVAVFRKLLEDCCDPGQLFAMTKLNSPMGKNLWFDGEFLYSFTIDNTTYSLFPQATPFQLPLKKCSVVGNGGILKKSGCGKQIDQADFVMRCNLPPLSREYSKDVGLKTQLVTANPSIIQKSPNEDLKTELRKLAGGMVIWVALLGCVLTGEKIGKSKYSLTNQMSPSELPHSLTYGFELQYWNNNTEKQPCHTSDIIISVGHYGLRISFAAEVSFQLIRNAELVTLQMLVLFQNLIWSRKAFVDSVKVYNHSYIYMPAFSMKTGTGPSLRVYYTLKDFGAKQAVLFANPNFLRDIGKFWKSKGIHAKRLSTGLFLVSAALGLCEEVTIYGFWPFSVDLHGKFISHHYYDNVLPDSGFHAMPEEFLQLWFLHKSGVLRMQLEQCEDPLTQSSA